MRIRGELVAVVLAVDGATPLVLASGDPARLPSGPLASDQRSLQGSVREFAAEQAGRAIGYVEQLYTLPMLTGSVKQGNGLIGSFRSPIWV